MTVWLVLAVIVAAISAAFCAEAVSLGRAYMKKAKQQLKERRDEDLSGEDG